MAVAEGNESVSIDWEAARERYKRDGVVHMPQVLGADALQAALKAWEWSIAHPHTGGNVPQKNDGIFFQDLFNPRVLEGYRSMLEASPIPDICAKLWGTDDVWFMYEQVFLKEGGETRRTPWHQDASYLPVGGADTAVAWITFDPISKEDSLEFVKGSHKGVLYNTSRFELGDDTAPINERSEMPRLPDIESERDRWGVVSWPVTPGDLTVFDFRTMHGGGSTHPGRRRRTLSLRFFGERSFFEPKNGTGVPGLPGLPDLERKLRPGDAFRDAYFLKLRSASA
jgi:hypothetical protein